MVLDKVDIERFWANVNIRGEGECWNWKRSCNVKGYGQFQLNRGMVRTHRVAWFLVNGSIPTLFEGLPTFICHTCDNRRCCNPNHLFLGNNKINQKDFSVKGRQAKSKGVLRYNVGGKAKPYQVKQLIKIIEKYNLVEEGK